MFFRKWNTMLLFLCPEEAKAKKNIKDGDILWPSAISQHNNGTAHFLMGKLTINGQFIARFNYQMVNVEEDASIQWALHANVGCIPAILCQHVPRLANKCKAVWQEDNQRLSASSPFLLCPQLPTGMIWSQLLPSGNWTAMENHYFNGKLYYKLPCSIAKC